MNEIGPWEVMGDRGHNTRPFWKLTRRNPLWTGYHYGRETALTPRGAIRRFYDKAKAEAECDRRNGKTTSTTTNQENRK